MKNRFRNFHILTVILIIAISQIMCNMLQKEDAIKPPVNAEVLPDLLTGVHDVTITDVKNNCPDNIEIPEFGPVESFEFTSDGVKGWWVIVGSSCWLGFERGRMCKGTAYMLCRAPTKGFKIEFLLFRQFLFNEFTQAFDAFADHLWLGIGEVHAHGVFAAAAHVEVTTRYVGHFVFHCFLEQFGCI